MDILKDFGVDAKRVREGVWIDLNTKEVVEEDAIKDRQVVKLARAGNRKFTQLYATKVLAARGNRRSLQEDADLRTRAEVIADTVILDWRNLVSNGKPFEYSKANVILLVVDETYSDFLDVLTGLAQDVSYFKAVAQEALVKNS